MPCKGCIMSVQQASLTYEKIFDIWSRERSRDDLQRIEDSFYADASAYIKAKLSMAGASPESQEKASRQADNIRRMLRDLYERRERKILNLALTASRTTPSFIDSSAMTSAENQLFLSLLDRMDHYRAAIVGGTARQSPRDYQPKAEPAVQPAVQPGNLYSDFKQVKFLQDVQRFVGLGGEIYGPFQAGQTANLPSQLANVLLNNGDASEVAG